MEDRLAKSWPAITIGTGMILMYLHHRSASPAPEVQSPPIQEEEEEVKEEVVDEEEMNQPLQFQYNALDEAKAELEDRPALSSGAPIEEEEEEEEEEEFSSLPPVGASIADLQVVYWRKTSGGIGMVVDPTEVNGQPLRFVLLARKVGEETYQVVQTTSSDSKGDLFLPVTLSGSQLRLNIHAPSPASQPLTDDNLIGTTELGYAELRESCDDGKLLSLPVTAVGSEKLSLQQLRVACQAVNLAFDLEKCLAWTKDKLLEINHQDMSPAEIPGFMAELEARWRHVDADCSGLLTKAEIRAAVWTAEGENAGVPVPPMSEPLHPDLQEIVDEIVLGTGNKPEITYWHFVNHTLVERDCIEDLVIHAPDEAWANA